MYNGLDINWERLVIATTPRSVGAIRPERGWAGPTNAGDLACISEKELSLAHGTRDPSRGAAFIFLFGTAEKFAFRI